MGTLLDLAVGREEVERPREHGRARLVTGGQERHELVAQRDVAHGGAVLVARGEEQREDVVARAALGVPRVRDLCVEQDIDALTGADEAAPRGARAEIALERAHHRRGGEGVRELRDGATQGLELGAFLDAEHGAEDHVERDRLHRRMDGEGAAGGPGLHRGERDVAHRAAVAVHARAVERREQELALAQVPRAVEQEQRVLTDDGPQALVGLACVHHVGGTGEDLLDVSLAREGDDADARKEAQRERVPVARATA